MTYRFLLWLVAAVAAVALCAPGSAVAAASMQMHRTQAGHLDGTGWTDAASAEGGFSVRMPLLFNDFSVIDSDPAAAVAVMHTLGGKNSAGVKFVATRFQYSAGEPAAQRYFAKFAAVKAMGTTSATVHKVQTPPYAGLDVELFDTRNFLLQRVLKIGPSLLVLQVEGPTGEMARSRAAAATFFASLRVGAGVPSATSDKGGAGTSNR